MWWPWSTINTLKENLRLETKRAEMWKKMTITYVDTNLALTKANEMLTGHSEAVQLENKTLKKFLLSVVEIPNIASLIQELTIIDAFNVPELSRFNLIITDNEHYSMPSGVWLDMLPMLYAATKKAIGVYRSEVADCDDWAATLQFIGRQAAIAAGLKRQPALLKVQSRLHMFNGFITTDAGIILFEPQSGQCVGLIDTVFPTSSMYAGIWQVFFP